MSFVVRNTSPIGWIPILLLKVWEYGPKVLVNYILGAILIFIPIILTSTYLDSLFYGQLTIVPWNFIKVNVFQGLSQTFGSDPPLLYFTKEIPIRMNILLPFLILGTWWYVKDCRAKRQSPFLVTYALSIVGFLSLISHKEPKFLLPIFPVFFIIIAKYLQDTFQKTNPGLIKTLTVLSILIELATNIWFVHYHEIGGFAPIKHV